MLQVLALSAFATAQIFAECEATCPVKVAVRNNDNGACYCDAALINCIGLDSSIGKLNDCLAITKSTPLSKSVTVTSTTVPSKTTAKVYTAKTTTTTDTAKSPGGYATSASIYNSAGSASVHAILALIAAFVI